MCLAEKDRMLWLFLKDSFSSLPAWSSGEFFSALRCEKLAELVGGELTKVWGPPRTASPRVFYSQSCPRGASSNSSVTVYALLPGQWSRAANLGVSVLTCLSLQLGRQRFALWPPLTNLNRFVDFSVCSPFHQLLGWGRGDWLLSSLRVQPEAGSSQTGLLF